MTHGVRNNFGLSAVLVILGAFCMAIQGAFAKISFSSIFPETFLFARFLIGFMLVSLYCTATINPRSAPTYFVKSKQTVFILRSLAGTISAVFYYYGLEVMSLSASTVLFFTFPLFVPLVARFWLKIKIFHVLWWGLGTAFIGIILVVQPTQSLFKWQMILPLFSGVLTAISTVSTRVLHYHAPIKKSLFFYFFYCSLFAFGFFLVRGLISPMEITGRDFFYLGVVSVAGLLYQMSWTVAMRYAPARVTTPFGFFCVIFSLGMDVFFWHKTPNYLELVGIIAIILGAVLVAVLFPKHAPIIYVGSKASEEKD